MDESGYIFIWKYEVDHFDDKIQMYRPAHKYRIALKYSYLQQIERLQTQNPKRDADLFDYLQLHAYDYRELLSTNGHHKFLTLHKRPPEKGKMFLKETVFNEKKEFVSEH